MEKNICLEKKCIKCCIQTSMILSSMDIERIKQQGYNIDYFVEKKKGWLQLKNKQGKCVFHNGEICLIYKNRPEGCKIYPLIYDKDYQIAILDEECPYKYNFKFNDEHIKRLDQIVKQVELERRKRAKKYYKK